MWWIQGLEGLFGYSRWFFIGGHTVCSLFGMQADRRTVSESQPMHGLSSWILMCMLLQHKKGTTTWNRSCLLQDHLGSGSPHIIMMRCAACFKGDIWCLQCYNAICPTIYEWTISERMVTWSPRDLCKTCFSFYHPIRTNGQTAWDLPKSCPGHLPSTSISPLLPHQSLA